MQTKETERVERAAAVKVKFAHTMDTERAKRAAAARAGRNRVKGKGHPTTADMDYTPREKEFMFAMHEYKRASGHQFPTWCEVLRVLDGLGYEQVGGLKVYRESEAA